VDGKIIYMWAEYKWKNNMEKTNKYHPIANMVQQENSMGADCPLFIASNKYMALHT